MSESRDDRTPSFTDEEMEDVPDECKQKIVPVGLFHVLSCSALSGCAPRKASGKSTGEKHRRRRSDARCRSSETYEIPHGNDTTFPADRKYLQRFLSVWRRREKQRVNTATMRRRKKISIELLATRSSNSRMKRRPSKR